MGRFNLLALALVVLSALSVITSQHQARRLFNDIDNEQAAAKKLDEEWTQLQLEQSTWATHKRVEAVASRSLGMKLPDSQSSVVLTIAGQPK
jgi:cell division protein FtsL